MAVTIGLWFAGVVGAAMVPIGARFFVQPAPASAGFGVPAAPDDAYLSVKGVRDVASGLFIGLLLLHGQPRLVGWFMLVATSFRSRDARSSDATTDLAWSRSASTGERPSSCW